MKPYLTYVVVDLDSNGTWCVIGTDGDDKKWRLGMNYRTELDGWKAIALGLFDGYATFSPTEKNIAQAVVEHLESAGITSAFQLSRALLPE